MAKDYTVSEEDIDAYILYSKHEEGISLSRSQARERLLEMQAGLHSLALTDPAKLAELERKLKDFRKD